MTASISNGVHSSGEPSRFVDSVITDTKDDGIDHNGARLIVSGAWIQGAMHEGIAASNRNWVTITDSVLTNNNQGVEAGYGRPDVTVNNSVLLRNDFVADPNTPITAGLRFGDGYDGRNGAYLGHITASHVVLHDNGDNIRNFDGTIPGPQPGAIEITSSLTNDVDAEPINHNGVPLFGTAMHLLRNSAGFLGDGGGLPWGRPIPATELTISRGDVNLDGRIDDCDIDRLWRAVDEGVTESFFDLNDNGSIDALDVDTLVREILNTEFGDIDLDGDIDFADFVVLSSHFGQASGRWATGNVDGQNGIAFSDFVTLTSRFGFRAEAQA